MSEYELLRNYKNLSIRSLAGTMKLFISSMDMLIILEIIFFTSKQFLKQNQNKKPDQKQIKTILFLVIIMTSFSLFTPFPYNLAWFIPVICSFYAFTKQYDETHLILSVILSLINCCVILANLLTTDFWRLLYKYQLLSAATFEQYHYWMYLPRYLLLAFLIVLLFIFFKRNRLITCFYTLKKQFPIKVTSYLICLFGLNFLRLYATYQGYTVDFIYVLSMIILFAIVAYSFVTLKATVAAKNEQVDWLNEKLVLEANNIALANEFKHDYRNILLSLSLYLEKQQTEEALAYVSKIIDYSKPFVDSPALKQLEKVNSIPIRALLLAFFKTADTQNVRVKYSIQTSFDEEQLGISVIDFIRCLSILLDNAFEAACLSTTPTIHLYFSTRGSQLFLRIVNSCPTSPDLELITKKHYSSKDGHQGIGLHTFQKILKNYPKASYNFSTKKQQFTIEVLF